MKLQITRRMATWAAAVTTLVCTGSLQAHHSIGMFDISTPVRVTGTITSYEPANPHAMIGLDVIGADGRMQRWTIEGPGTRRLGTILATNRVANAEDFLKVGDIIEVCGFALKPDFRRAYQSRAADDAPPPLVHGHVLVMPDGRMQSWGPYGRIENCVRPDDPQSWLHFLDSDPQARQFWCRIRNREEIASPAVQAAVDEIDAQFSCGP